MPLVRAACLTACEESLLASGYPDRHRPCPEELKSLFIKTRLKLSGDRLGKWHTGSLLLQWDSDGEFSRLGCAHAGYSDSVCDKKESGKCVNAVPAQGLSCVECGIII